MPTLIGRDELRTLTGQGAQLVEVLPAEEYDWGSGRTAPAPARTEKAARLMYQAPSRSLRPK